MSSPINGKLIHSYFDHWVTNSSIEQFPIIYLLSCLFVSLFLFFFKEIRQLQLVSYTFFFSRPFVFSSERINFPLICRVWNDCYLSLHKRKINPILLGSSSTAQMRRGQKKNKFFFSLENFSTLRLITPNNNTTITRKFLTWIIFRREKLIKWIKNNGIPHKGSFINNEISKGKEKRLRVVVK